MKVAKPKIYTALLTLLIITGAATPVLADSDGDAAYAKMQNLSERASTAFDEASADYENGSYSSACSLFSEASELYKSAILASLPVLFDSDYNHDEIENLNETLQTSANDSRDNAETACKVAAE